MPGSGKAYSEHQKASVKTLLEQGRDEEAIEKETGVSDRTIRRWKLELERTGRIGKPPESRTGRHRVLNPDIEAALCEYVKDKPEMSVDDMLWWLYDNYKIVVGTRTIRRVFERKGEYLKPGKTKNPTRRKSGVQHNEQDEGQDMNEGVLDIQTPPPPPNQNGQYQSPYPPMAPQAGPLDGVEDQLRQAMQQDTPQHPYPSLMDQDQDLPEDEETIQLQLQQIALQKREVELKLKMRRLQHGKGTPQGSGASSILFNPEVAMQPVGPKRDSRSKKKIQESKQRTADRQERMLRDLERRSRRRDHLTAEWVLSKDIWPLRAQSMLADLMHDYTYYTYSQRNDATFETIYRELYQLVDLTKGDWDPQVHDDLLRDRVKRKMGQLRNKMQKTGEIIGRGDSISAFQKADNYTGEAAGQTVGDESEMVHDPSLQSDELQTQAGAAEMQSQQHHHHPEHMQHPDHMQHPEHMQHTDHMQHPEHMQHPDMQNHDHMQHPEHMQHQEHLQYEPVPDPQMQHNVYPNPMIPHQAQGGYAMMDPHQNMMPYAPLGPQQMGNHDSMVM